MTIRSGLAVLIKCFMIVLGMELGMWVIGSLGMTTIPLRIIAIATIAFIPLLLVFWWAEAIIDYLTPRSDRPHAEAPLKRDDLQAIAFSAVGAYILYNAIHQSLYLILYFWQSQVSGALPPMPPDTYIKPIISWLVGGYLLFGAPTVARLIGDLRRTGSTAERE
jgi:hypothetical protein